MDHSYAKLISIPIPPGCPPNHPDPGMWAYLHMDERKLVDELAKVTARVVREQAERREQIALDVILGKR